MAQIATPSQRPDTPLRIWNLALCFQEIFTVVLRIRHNKQAVPSAEVFRDQIRQALRQADADAKAQGYAQEDVQQAIFAVVAFVDESILASGNPVFAQWPNLTLQQEFYGGHVAGDLFFQALQKVLGRNETTQTADLLEVFQVCLSLGYRGRMASNPGEVVAIQHQIREKMTRVRGVPGALSPRGELPSETPRAATGDPWVRRFAWTAVACAILAIVLFGLFKFMLISDLSQVHSAVAMLTA